MKRLSRTERSQLIVDALVKKYEGDIAEANANMQVYISNSVGIGEHSEVMVEIDKQLEKISAAEEKLETLKKYTSREYYQT
jgi:hypothetical protein|tara:strand:+ start:6472 stop:6714 length:243 start_codon:yes stop_codon:yes gene_type:complete